jgi:tetratricopeptide (TPR) repeat protein
MMLRRSSHGAVLIALLLTGLCSYGQTPTVKPDPSGATKAFLEGAKALEKDDLRTAVKDFQRAFQLAPQNRDYATSLTIAREHLLTKLVQDASKSRLLGNNAAARADLAEAYTLDPQNPIVAQHLDELARDYEPHDALLAPAVETSSPPVNLSPSNGKMSFHLRSAGTDVLRQVLSAYGIVPTLDSSVPSQLVRFDVDNVDFAQAAQMLKLATGTFFVPLDEKRVLVAADTKDNRAKFERQVMETIYLPGLTPDEATGLGNAVRQVFEIQQATIQQDQHTLTVRGPKERVEALNHTLAELLAGRGQVLLNLRLYEIDQSRLVNLGAQLPQQTTVFNVPSEVNQIIQNNQSAVQQIISSGLANAGDNLAIVAILIASGVVSGTVFNQPFALFGGGITESGLTLNQSATLNLSLNSSDTRAIDNVQLRVQDQDQATFRSGTRYPIVTSTYSNLAGSSLNIPGISQAGLSSYLQNLGISAASLQSSLSTTIPQVQYQDLGLTLTATPRIQQDHDVSLKLDLKIVSLTGQTLDGNPVLSNRQYTGNITLARGESALVVSNITKQQSAAISGIPGLSELPGFLQSTTNKDTQVSTTKLIVLITPYIVRLGHTQPAGQMVMLPVH